MGAIRKQKVGRRAHSNNRSGKSVTAHADPMGRFSKYSQPDEPGKAKAITKWSSEGFGKRRC